MPDEEISSDKPCTMRQFHHWIMKVPLTNTNFYIPHTHKGTLFKLWQIALCLSSQLFGLFSPNHFYRKEKGIKGQQAVDSSTEELRLAATDTAKVNRLWIYQNEKNIIFTGYSCLPSTQQRSKWSRCHCADSVQNAVCVREVGGDVADTSATGWPCRAGHINSSY